MQEERKTGFPCDDCEVEEQFCVQHGKYIRCTRWIEWFTLQWRALQKLFALNVSNRHKEKGGDDE